MDSSARCPGTPGTIATPGTIGVPDPGLIAGWFAELGLDAFETSEREGTTSWDFRLDGRRRFDVRVTVILDPGSGVFVWVPLAPPLNDNLRKSYKRLLQWNDEYPFVKFGLATDDRPVVTAEIPSDRLQRDELGLAVARLLTICDLLLDETASWIWIGGRLPDDWEGRVGRQVGLLARYADQLGELAAR